MADEEITDLPGLAAAVAADLLVVVDDVAGTPITKKMTLASLMSALLITGVSRQIFTSGSGTWTPASGTKAALAIVQGGGGGGGHQDPDSVGGGGGGGGCAIKLLTGSNIAAMSYSVGAGAVNNGANSTLSVPSGTMTGGGGTGGVASGISTTLGTAGDGGAGGTASGGDLNMPGGDGKAGVLFSTSLGQGGNGGDSFLGNGGRGGSDNEIGTVGKLYGGGGGGTHAASSFLNDIAGGNGVIIIFEFK